MNPIGTIVATVLRFDDFLRQVPGEKWMIAHGGAIDPAVGAPLIKIIENDPYYRALNPGNRACAPDLRGVFLRGKNGERNVDEGNPAGDVNVGVYQNDDVGPHRHGANGGTPGADRTGHNGDGRYGNADTPTTDPYGDDPHTRKESRPRNVTVNFYIRVG
jgi:hypothetical protein